MNSWDFPLEPWDLVWGDVEGYDRAVVLASMSDLFRGLERAHGPLVTVPAAKKKPRENDPPPKVTFAGDFAAQQRIHDSLRERLVAIFPHWYGRQGWRVGNETFGGCTCCSFPRAIGGGPDEAAKWVATELELMRAAVCGFAPIVRRVAAWEDPATRPGAVQNAVGDVVDVMIDNGWTSESWYQFADDGVRWLLSVATELPPSAPVLCELGSYNFAFTSWTGPSATDKARFAEHVAALARAY